MFAGDAHALLSGRGSLVGSLFQAQERIFKLYHTGIGEEQIRRVGQQRRGRHYGVLFLAKEIEK